MTGLTGTAATAACIALILLFGVLAYSASMTKCATADEVVHAPSAYTHLRYFDFRSNPEHPPLWKYWAALPWLASPPGNPNISGPEFQSIPEDINNEWAWGEHTLYNTPGNDPVKLLGMSRMMMLLWALGLGGLIAWWGWRAAGPVAALVACALFALDPNFLAHSALVTNDVAFSLTTLAVAYAMWRVGDSATWLRILALALLCGVTVTTKFTGILAGPIVAIALLIRALMPQAWTVLGRPVQTRLRRVAAALAICVFCAVITYGCIWAAYGFRFRTAPDPRIHPNLDQMVAEAAVNEIMSRTGKPATMEEVRAWYPSLYVRSCIWGLQHRILPDPFLNGLFFAYDKSLFRWSFLLGKVTGQGHWYYFPVAMMVKTPLATLAAIVAALVALWQVKASRGERGDPMRGAWLWICFALPFTILGYAFLRSHLNIGLRHVLPLYPFLFLTVGIVAARVLALWPKQVRLVLAGLGVALAAESLLAYPDYIPFFNAAVGGAEGGIYILGDSNLDWGQDLPALAAWQQKHPDKTLYLAYFGTADPNYYHIRHIPMVSLTVGIDYRPDITEFPQHGVIAVSATMLQGIWIAPPIRRMFDPLRGRKPTAILGGSIYLYDLDQP